MGQFVQYFPQPDPSQRTATFDGQDCSSRISDLATVTSARGIALVSDDFGFSQIVDKVLESLSAASPLNPASKSPSFPSEATTPLLPHKTSTPSPPNSSPAPPPLPSSLNPNSSRTPNPTLLSPDTQLISILPSDLSRMRNSPSLQRVARRARMGNRRHSIIWVL